MLNFFESFAMLFKTNNFRNVRYLFFLLSTIPIYNLLSTSYYKTVDFPLTDDFEAILNFIILWHDQPSIQEKFTLLFAQHNEHRLVFLRIVTLLQLKIFGNLNFKHLIITGNFFLILTLIILIFKANRRIRWLYSVPASFLFLNLSSWENQSWAMASLSNFPVLTFSVLSLAILDKIENRFSFIAAIFFAILASFSQGNGLFVFIAGLPLIGRSKRKWTIWLLSGSIIYLFYFFFLDYVRPGHTTGSLLLFDLIFIKNIISYVLHLLASPLYSKLNLFIGSIIVTIIFSLIFMIKSLAKFDLAILIFFFLTIISLAFGRVEFGSGQALSSRYTIYPLLIYVTIFKIFMVAFPKPDTKWLLISFLTIIFYYNVNAINIQLLEERKTLLTNSKNCYACEEFSVAPNPKRAQYVLENAKPYYNSFTKK